MKSKKKYFIISVVIIVPILIAIFIYSSLFTDLFFKPTYLFSAGYNDYFYDSKRIVNIKEINSLNISYSDYKFVTPNMKYCKNMSKLEISLNDLRNIDFLSDLNYIDTLITTCKSQDWSGISGCKNTKFISLIKSDFSDLGLFSGFSELSELRVQSNKKMLYSGFDTMPSLKTLALAVENIDIKEISKAEKINDLEVHCLKETVNVNYLLEMNNLENIYFGKCDIDKETLSVISNMRNLKELCIYNCSFLCDEKTVQKYLSVISEKGTDVKTNEHNTYSDSEDK